MNSSKATSNRLFRYFEVGDNKRSTNSLPFLKALKGSDLLGNSIDSQILILTPYLFGLKTELVADNEPKKLICATYSGGHHRWRNVPRGKFQGYVNPKQNPQIFGTYAADFRSY